MRSLLALFLWMPGCGAVTPLDLGAGADSDADGGDADADSDGGFTCDDLCDRVRKCDPDHAASCASDCARVQSGLTSDAFQQKYADCLDAPCAEIEGCERLPEVDPQPYHESFCEAACARRAECGYAEPDCAYHLCDLHEGDFDVATLSQKVIEELTACLSRDCGDPMEACFDSTLEKHFPR
jgi:hypothetical protein